MDTQDTFFKTSGGGQFFQRIGEQFKAICLYDFNPCIERMRYTPDLLTSLKCVAATEAEFLAAEQQALVLLGVVGAQAGPLPGHRLTAPPIEAYRQAA